MRSILVAETIFILMGGNLIAQTPSVEWIKIIGGGRSCCSMQRTIDNGYIIAGWTDSFGDTVNGNIYLVKVDSLCNLQWQRTFAGSYEDKGQSAKQTFEKGYIILSAIHGDFFLIKTDSLGNLTWQKTFGGEGLEIAYSVQQTMDKGYIVGGMSDTGGIYIIKTDSSGNLQWEKTYGGDYGDEEHLISVVQVKDGGYIIAGDPDHLLKTDSLGNLHWRKKVELGFPFIQLTLDNCYVIATGGNYLLKTDSLGNLLWEKTFGSKNKHIAVSFVQPTLDKGYILTGYINSGKTDTVGDQVYYDARNEDIYLIKTDSLGNSQWEWTYHQSYMDEGISAFPTDNGGYVLLGRNGKLYFIKTRQNKNEGN